MATLLRSGAAALVLCLVALTGCDSAAVEAAGPPSASLSSVFITGPTAMNPGSVCGFAVSGATSVQWINPAGSFTIVGGTSTSAAVDLQAPSTEGEYLARATTNAGVVSRLVKVTTGSVPVCGTYY